jgi:hypothetical protein
MNSRNYILIDDSLACAAKCLRNAIIVPSYSGSKLDFELISLKEFLISTKDSEDMSAEIPKYFKMEYITTVIKKES